MSNRRKSAAIIAACIAAGALALAPAIRGDVTTLVITFAGDGPDGTDRQVEVLPTDLVAVFPSIGKIIYIKDGAKVSVNGKTFDVRRKITRGDQ